MSEPTPIEITEAAGDWLDRLSAREASEADRLAFAEWVRTSPVHIAEFLRVSALHAELTGTLSGQEDWVSGLIDEAGSAIVSFPDRGRVADVDPGDDRTPGIGSGPNPGSNRRTRWLSAAAVVAVVTAGAFWALQPASAKTIATELGEQRTVVLADGSTLQLNTDSIVLVSMGKALRQLELQRGELLVDVAKDSERKFRVRTDEAVVEAIGTRFNVWGANCHSTRNRCRIVIRTPHVADRRKWRGITRYSGGSCRLSYAEEQWKQCNGRIADRSVSHIGSPPAFPTIVYNPRRWR